MSLWGILIHSGYFILNFQGNFRVNRNYEVCYKNSLLRKRFDGRVDFCLGFRVKGAFLCLIEVRMREKDLQNIFNQIYQ